MLFLSNAIEEVRDKENSRKSVQEESIEDTIRNMYNPSEITTQERKEQERLEAEKKINEQRRREQLNKRRKLLI